MSGRLAGAPRFQTDQELLRDLKLFPQESNWQDIITLILAALPPGRVLALLTWVLEKIVRPRVERTLAVMVERGLSEAPILPTPIELAKELIQSVRSL